MTTTYLLGAGASVGALPTYDTIWDRLEYFVQLLRNRNSQVFRLLSGFPNYDVIATRFEDLYQQSRSARLNLYSPDQFARILIDVQRDYESAWYYKMLLSLYILFEQTDKNLGPGISLLDSTLNIPDIERLQTQAAPFVDGRYSTFVLNKLVNDKGIAFPDDVNILTWNYDTQFELIYQAMLGSSVSIADAVDAFSVFPNPAMNPKGAKIVKLNGSAAMFESGGETRTVDQLPLRSLPFDIDLPTNIQNLARVLSCMDEAVSLDKPWKKFNPLIAFAWDRKGGSDNFPELAFQCAYHILRQTEKLVVIGYSFPSFNKSYDQSLFADQDIRECVINTGDNTETGRRFKKLSKAEVRFISIDVGYFPD